MVSSYNFIFSNLLFSCKACRNIFSLLYIGTIFCFIGSLGILSKYLFFVPAYQRGYRWTNLEVLDLLNDIDEFEPRETRFKAFELSLNHGLGDALAGNQLLVFLIHHSDRILNYVPKLHF